MPGSKSGSGSGRHGLPTGTVTFLFSDIEGSTRLLARLGPSGYADALAGHRQILREAITAQDGVEVDAQGDAIFAAFPTASGAVAAAQAAQAGLRDGPITVRIGIHTGTATATVDGYVGIDVHRGARVAALAHGGQVLISAATAALVETVPMEDLGRHRLKDFDAPIRIFQLGTTRFPPLRTPGAVDLPTPPSRFLGRQGELHDAVGRWLELEPRVLTIVGPGGTGKTRFAIELARFLADDADGGTVYIALAPVRDATLVVPMIATVLGASGDTAAAIGARIGGKPTHIVLDNLEQLLPDVAPRLAEVLTAAPTLRILATSREPLRIAGEVEFDLQPMEEAEAVALFVQRAMALRGDIGSSPAIPELVRRLDGLPLAIELAAARMNVLGPKQLLERITQRLDLLKGGRDVDERHSTLRATIAWSYDLLDADEQLLFGRLALFRGGCSLADVEAVCDGDIETLASLLDKSLVRRRVVDDDEDRYWMLETIRDFARERLDAAGEEDLLRRSQEDRLFELVDRAGTRAVIHGPERWDFDLLAPEIDNIRAVLEWSLDADPERGLRLAAWMESFWVVRDPIEGASWLERLLDRADDADPMLRARALRALGGTLDIVGEPDRAAPYYRQSLDLFVAAGASKEAAHGRFRVATNMIYRGERAEAWPLMEGALDDFLRLGMRLGECQVLGVLAQRSYREGDVTLALRQVLESAAIADEAGWAWWAAQEYDDAATFERELGHLDAAEGHATRSLDLAFALGDRRVVLFAAADLAIIAAARGDAGRAGRLWGAIEVEAESGRVGQWEQHRAALERDVLVIDSEAFRSAWDEGRMLSVRQAAAPGPD